MFVDVSPRMTHLALCHHRGSTQVRLDKWRSTASGTNSRQISIPWGNGAKQSHVWHFHLSHSVMNELITNAHLRLKLNSCHIIHVLYNSIQSRKGKAWTYHKITCFVAWSLLPRPLSPFPVLPSIEWLGRNRPSRSPSSTPLPPSRSRFLFQLSRHAVEQGTLTHTHVHYLCQWRLETCRAVIPTGDYLHQSEPSAGADCVFLKQTQKHQLSAQHASCLSWHL